MSMPTAASVGAVLVPGSANPAHSATVSDVDGEVIALFDRFRDPVLRYVLWFGLPIHDGEEITQDVFVALFQHLRLGRPRQNLPGWIFRVAHNLALKRRYANDRSRGAIQSGSIAVEMQSDPSPNPEEYASFAQKRERLLAIFHALSPEDRCCLRLRAEGLRYREIAQTLGISLGAVSISLTRSLARMMPPGGR